MSARKSKSTLDPIKVIEDPSDPAFKKGEVVSVSPGRNPSVIKASESKIRVGLEEFANRHYKGRFEMMMAFVLEEKQKEHWFDLEKNYAKCFHDFAVRPVT